MESLPGQAVLESDTPRHPSRKLAWPAISNDDEISIGRSTQAGTDWDCVREVSMPILLLITRLRVHKSDTESDFNLGPGYSLEGMTMKFN